MEIRLTCPTCGRTNHLAIPAGADLEAAPSCRGCSRALPLNRSGPPQPGRPVRRCAVCGDDKLFVQKDFDQKIGCLIVGTGAVLVPWTYGLSLGVCALIDYLLYRRLDSVTVCYICKTRHRGFAVNPDHAPFDLMTAQTYEARSLNWRRLHERAPRP